MTLFEVRLTLQAELLTRNTDLSQDIRSVCASDLMSDVLAFHSSHTLILTGLANQQTIRTAEIADASGVIFVRGKRPDGNVIALADKKNIPLMLSISLIISKLMTGMTQKEKKFHLGSKRLLHGVKRILIKIKCQLTNGRN